MKPPPAALALLALSAALAGPPAAAQLQLPGLPGVADPLPRLPLPRPADAAAGLREGARPLLQSLDAVRRDRVQALLREQRDLVEADPGGAPVRRGELLLADPAPALLAAAQAEGFRVLRETRLAPLDLRQVVLAPPRGLSLAAALARLRELDPGLQADYQHLYMPGSSTHGGGAPPAPVAPAAGPLRVGLVDGGVDARHPALRGHRIEGFGCAGAAAPAGEHGTAVASLLLTGAAAGATLYAADVYCGEPAGGSAEAVAQALAWLAQQRVGVVNVSLVGPPNRLLQRVVAAMLARGHAIVAAVGNDGPAAPPLYPASWPGVLGVSGVLPTLQPLPEAAQGPQVAFAAPGAGLAAARAGSRRLREVRGTSFAAPLVAALLAARLAEPDAAAREAALAALRAQARDLGAPGRDPVYGDGLLAEPMLSTAAR